MKLSHALLRHPLHLLALLMLTAVTSAHAAGGYFILGYGPYAHQMAGTSTAVGFDSFAGSSNPAKLVDAGTRLDPGLVIFMPYRRIDRIGAADPSDDFSSTSDNGVFFLPELGYAHQLNPNLSWGVAMYGNGGLNTKYTGTNGVPGSNANPAKCGQQAANFVMGCGAFGADLSQLIIAPTLSWKFAPGQSVGIAPLLGYQRIRIYGLEAFEALSEYPNQVTDNGYDQAFGVGVRIGWLGRITPWLDLGAAYSSKIYMQDLHRYQGFFAGRGSFDVPENYSIGIGLRPLQGLLLGFDIQRIMYHEINALGNGLLNSLQDPPNDPLGSHNGSGLNWRNQNNFRGGIEYAALTQLKLRVGAAYARRPDDESRESVTLNLLTPNPVWNLTTGFTWSLNAHNDLDFAYGYYVKGTYKGPSAIAGANAVESLTPYVNTVRLGWAWRM